MLDFGMREDEVTRAYRSRARATADAWREAGKYVPSPDNWMRGFDPDFSAELSRQGLVGMTWPKRYGGGGARNVDRLAVTEELLRAGAPVAAHWMADRQIGPAVLRHGSPELIGELLPGMIAARSVYCLGMSEPEAGSDLASVRTTAREHGDGYLLRGRKVWTTGAHRATHMYVLARTDRGERKYDGLSEFVLDMDSPGVYVEPIPDIAGEHHFNEVTFDDVPVPARRLIGERGRGWAQVVEQLSFERGGPERFLSSYPLMAGIVGHPHAAGGGHDERIGSMVARLGALRRLARHVAALMDEGKAPVRESATLKLLGNAFELDLVDLARTVHGGPVPLGSMIGGAIVAMPGFGIRGGAADVLLSLIARQEARA
jgi:acyl-CoA dehydrogenase